MLILSDTSVVGENVLKNRILVVGLGQPYLDLLAQVRKNVLFIALERPEQFSPQLHVLEGLMFSANLLEKMQELLAAYRGRPIYGVGSESALQEVEWIKPPPQPREVEALLSERLGEIRQPSPTTGLLNEGVLVKNKNFPDWGIGVVVTELDDGLYRVHFPKAVKFTTKTTHVCHRTTLRIIGSIKEFKREAS
jgi:hypothetical protein